MNKNAKSVDKDAGLELRLEELRSEIKRRGMKFLPRRPLAQCAGDPCISAGTGEPRDPPSLARINVLRIVVRTGAAGGRARYETPRWTPTWRSTNDACRTHAALSSPLTATADDCVPLGNPTGEFTIAGAPAVRH